MAKKKKIVIDLLGGYDVNIGTLIENKDKQAFYRFVNVPSGKYKDIDYCWCWIDYPISPNKVLLKIELDKTDCKDGSIMIDVNDILNQIASKYEELWNEHQDWFGHYLGELYIELLEMYDQHIFMYVGS